MSATYLVMGRSGTKAGAGAMEVYFVYANGGGVCFAGLLASWSLLVLLLEDLAIFYFPVHLCLAFFMLFFFAFEECPVLYTGCICCCGVCILR